MTYAFFSTAKLNLTTFHDRLKRLPYIIGERKEGLEEDGKEDCKQPLAHRKARPDYSTMRVPSIAVLCILCIAPATSFVTLKGMSAPGRKLSIMEMSDDQTKVATGAKETEKLLRKEIADRNSIVDSEEKYAMIDGEGVAALQEKEPSEEVATEADAESWEAQVQKMIRKRAYALFLLEKAAEIGEKAIDDIFDGPKYPLGGKKEKIVVLGTGWGAASFLKDIDTDLYDVTIVSPRNYFVFTPMLAGASVGTVEFRSITEPVREVSTKLFMRRFPSLLTLRSK